MKRDDLLKNVEADRAFVTKNEHKPARERWVVDQWLVAQGRPAADVSLGEDPPDFLVDGVGIEIVEAMEEGRKRGDEYKDKVEAAKDGFALVRTLPNLRQVKQNGHLWILSQVQQKIDKFYDRSASSGWVLLVYVNFSFADRVEWSILEEKLLQMHPPFASIEVVYSAEEVGDVPSRHVARTVFAAQRGIRP